jgi:F0F1-type ATP synthase assembly protein I
MPAPRQEGNLWALLGRYSSLAMLLPAATFAGYVCGYLLDRWLGTKFFTVICLLLGIAGGLVQFIRQVQKDSRRDNP